MGFRGPLPNRTTSPDHSISTGFFFFKDLVIYFWREGKEGGEGEKYQCARETLVALTRKGPWDPLVCGTMPSPLSHTSQGSIVSSLLRYSLPSPWSHVAASQGSVLSPEMWTCTSHRHVFVRPLPSWHARVRERHKMVVSTGGQPSHLWSDPKAFPSSHQSGPIKRKVNIFIISVTNFTREMGWLQKVF